MSDVVYPLGPVGQLDVQRFDRTIFDEFEDGSQQSRRLWSAKTFKRRFTVSHENLTEAEFKRLRDFFTARDGRYDSFWFRDNWNRGGNAKVRLAGDFPITRSGKKFYSPRLVMEQTAPVRELPTTGEATALFLSRAWYDPNRQIAYAHETTSAGYGEATVANQYGSTGYDLATNSGNVIIPGGTTSQWQYWDFLGTDYLKTSGSLNFGSQPSFSFFAIVKHGTVSSREVVVAAGTIGSGACVGIEVSAGNYYQPFLGGSETWATARYSNSTSGTWRSVAVTWASASNTAKLYVNGVLIGSESNTRGTVNGPVTMGAASDGTLKAASLTTSYVGPVVIAAEYSLADIQELHNLFAHQYGLATV